ncbi:MAG: hypothetical protein AAB601_00560 [Patescibacteria group bacterium]
MKDRTKSILSAAVRDFIRTGIPVTSERLFEAYDFGIKPAMIRRELNDLAAAGYFYQVHPSGGRLPTNRAYRFVVGELLAETDSSTVRKKETQLLAREFLHGERSAFIEEIAEYLNLFGVGYEFPRDALYESGLWSLIDRLEVEAKREILRVVEDIELLPERLGGSQSWLREGDAWPHVFVGESPVTKSEHLSVIAGRFCSPKDGAGRGFLLLTIGPKRMDYRKTISLFRELRRSCEKEHSSIV